MSCCKGDRMGLTDTIKSAVAAGFTAAGDTTVSLTFTQVTGTNYDPSTGTNTETTVEYTDIEGFRRNYTIREIQAGVASAGEIRLVVQAADIGFDLGTIDRITIASTEYQIKEIQPDAVGATYVIRLTA